MNVLARTSGSSEGFQPMEMDLTAFEDEEVGMDEESESYFRQRGGGGKSKSWICRPVVLIGILVLLVIGGAIFSISTAEMETVEMENDVNEQNGVDENPTMEPTTLASTTAKIEDDEESSSIVVEPSNPPTPSSTTSTEEDDENTTTPPEPSNPPTPSSTTSTEEDDENTTTPPEIVVVAVDAPIATRDEDRVVYLGAAPPDWDTDVPRQEDNSEFSLLDPPIAVPDPYGWLRRDYDDDVIHEEILDYLNAENKYTGSMTTHTTSLQNSILEELKFVMEETFHTLPQQFFQDGYYYYTRTIKDVPYALHCRAPVDFDEEVSSATADNGANLKDPNDNKDEKKQIKLLAHYLNTWAGTEDSEVLPGEVVWLDENNLVMEGVTTHLDVGDVAVSPDGTWVAYTIDDSGNEVYHLIIEEVYTVDNDSQKTIFWGRQGAGFGEISPTVLFGNERTTLFLVESDGAQRDSSVQRCEIQLLQEGMMGSNRLVCELLFEEPDIEYWVSIRKTLDQRYLLVETASSDTSEVWYLDLMMAANTYNDTVVDGDDEEDDVATATTLIPVAHRIPNVLYSVDHGNGIWWMTSNIFKKEFDILYAPVGSHHWTSVNEDNDDDEEDEDSEKEDNPTSILMGHFLEDVTVLENHLVIQGRLESSGLPQIWIAKLDETNHAGILSVVPILDDVGAAHSIDFVGSATGAFDTSAIVIKYQSLVTPTQLVVVDLDEDEFEIPVRVEGHGGEDAVAEMLKETLLMQTPAEGYDAVLFECQRILVPSRPDDDGETTLIPVSLVYLKSTMTKAETEQTVVPLHLYAYGAYGVSIEDTFSSSRLPLLQRGVMYAIAHVRGGGELGQAWYEDGKLLNKMHTFEDFIDVAKHFIETKQWTTSDLLSIEGRSAGGLTMGAVVNLAPELFRAAVLGVPFVDVLATMSDATIPLTALEWLEWGNPNEDESFEYMKGYSPVNNVRADVTYPSMLILAGLYDPRVAYWEPAKLTATLRYSVNNAPDERPILLKTDMTSGHFSASDRCKHLQAQAFEYAFLLDQLGIRE
jgi:oligopeptidase B